MSQDTSPPVLVSTNPPDGAVDIVSGTQAILTFDEPVAPGAGTDFNGDGMCDVLLQNANGQIAVWLMNGASISSGAVVANPGSDWQPAGTGDFNGDGKSDILLQHADGRVGIWLMSGTNIVYGVIAGVTPGPAWHVGDAGDFDGNGTSDIVVQDGAGHVAVWLSNGTSVLSGAEQNLGSGWHVDWT